MARGSFRLRQSFDVAVVTIGLLLVGYGTNVSTPYLVLYRDRLDLGPSATMAIFAIYVVGIFSTLLLAGPLSDRYGRRALGAPFLALSGLASLVLILGRDSFPLLLLGRYLLGAVSGGFLGVGSAWLQELMGRGNEQRAAVLATVVTYFGFGFGPPVSAVFARLDLAPLVTPFVLHCALSIAFVPLLLRARETVARSPTPPPIRVHLGIPPHAQHLFRRTVLPAAIWIFGFPSTSFALFPVLVSDAVPGFDVTVAALCGAFTAWAALAARPVIGRFGAHRSLPIGMAMGTVGYVFGTLAFAFDLWPFVLPSAALLGAASGTLTASSLGLLGEQADAATRGSLNSTVYLLAYPGMAMPIVLTTVAEVTGMEVALIGVTLVAAVCTLAVGNTARLINRRAPTSQASPV